MSKTKLKRIDSIVDLAMLACGVVFAGIGLEGFLIPNGFLDGGVTGISMFFSEITGLPLSLYLFIVNIPFIIIGWRYMGRQHAMKGIVTIIALAAALFLFQVPVITQDKLLDACFGGFLLGGGIGLALRGGGVLDGTDMVAVVISRKTGLSVGTIILLFNLVLFSVVAAVLGLERAMYSILTYLVASKSADLVLYGIEEYAAVIIISNMSPMIRMVLLGDLGIGLTSYSGRTGFSKTEQDILYCVVSRFDIPLVRETVLAIDEKAFIVTHSITDSSGGMIRSRVRRFQR